MMESRTKKDLEKLPVRVRAAAPTDVSFIFSSWLKSFRASSFTKNMSNTVFYSEHHKVIEDILKTSTVLIACNEKEPQDIYAYIVAERIDGIMVLHYVYVKHTYRQFGLAKMLWQQFDQNSGQAGICTHMTRIGERLALKYNLVYSPYLAMTKEYRDKAMAQAAARGEVVKEEDVSEDEQ